MPNFDRTGPRGAGSMTGRAMGMCGGQRNVQATDPAVGQARGRRQRRGWGFGRGRGSNDVAPAVPTPAPVTLDDGETDPDERRAVLKAERNRLKSRLREVEDVLTGIGRALRGEGES